MVIVDLLAATICFMNQCYPALVGSDTPAGEFQLEQVTTRAPGYGGDILLFDETPKSVYAIHRIWLLNPKQRRLERLQSSDPRQRITVTMGCINIMPDVYEKLVDCCSNDTLRVN